MILFILFAFLFLGPTSVISGLLYAEKSNYFYRIEYCESNHQWIMNGSKLSYQECDTFSNCQTGCETTKSYEVAANQFFPNIFKLGPLESNFLDPGLEFSKKGMSTTIKENQAINAEFYDYGECQTPNWNNLKYMKMSLPSTSLLKDSCTIDGDDSAHCECQNDEELVCYEHKSSDDCSDLNPWTDNYYQSSCSYSNYFCGTSKTSGIDGLNGIYINSVKLSYISSNYRFLNEEKKKCYVIKMENDVMNYYRCDLDCQNNCVFYDKYLEFTMNQEIEQGQPPLGKIFKAESYAPRNLEENDVALVKFNDDGKTIGIINYLLQSLNEKECFHNYTSSERYSLICKNQVLHKEYYSGFSCSSGEITRTVPYFQEQTENEKKENYKYICGPFNFPNDENENISLKYSFSLSILLFIIYLYYF